MAGTAQGFRCPACSVCDNCSRPLTRTRLGYKCTNCRFCKNCLLGLIKTDQDYVCPGCGVCHQILEHNYDSNLTFNERVQVDTSSSAIYGVESGVELFCKSAGSYVDTSKILHGVPQDLIRKAVGDEVTTAKLYTPSVWNAVRSIPDLEGFDETCLRRIVALTMDYIYKIHTNSVLSHMTLPKNKQVMIVTALIFALQSQNSVVGIHESTVIQACWDQDGDFAKFKNRVLNYCANLKLGSIVPQEHMIDEREHRANIFQRWCSKFELVFQDRKIVQLLLDKCVTEVWLGGRQFEYCAACVFKHLFHDGCKHHSKMMTRIDGEDLKFLIKDILAIQWKTLKKGTDILNQIHDA